MGIGVEPVAGLAAMLLATSWLTSCCPCNSTPDPPTSTQPKPTQEGEPKPPKPLQPPTASAPKAQLEPEKPCTGELANSELPCMLPDRRWGWCKGGRCKDVCPAGFSYSHLDTACHKPCGTGCKNCMDEACLDDATTRPMLGN